MGSVRRAAGDSEKDVYSLDWGSFGGGQCMAQVAGMADSEAPHCKIRHRHRNVTLWRFPDWHGAKWDAERFHSLRICGKIQSIEAKRLTRCRFPVAMILRVEMTGQNNVGGGIDRVIPADIGGFVRIEKNANACCFQQKRGVAEPGQSKSGHRERFDAPVEFPAFSGIISRKSSRLKTIRPILTSREQSILERSTTCY